jgi:hypothetical protein
MGYYTARGRDVEEDPAGTLSARARNAGRLAFQQDLGDSSALEANQLALAALLAAGGYVPGGGQVAGALDDCVVVDGLTEAVEKLVTTDEAVSGGVDFAEYEDGFYNVAGDRVGTVTGTAVVLCYTPHMWQYHSSTTEFHDGTFETNGVIDCTAILNGMTQVLRVVGTGGRYAGKQGFMTLTLHDHRKQPPLYRTQFVMR